MKWDKFLINLLEVYCNRQQVSKSFCFTKPMNKLCLLAYTFCRTTWVIFWTIFICSKCNKRGAPAHFSIAVRSHLHQTFSRRLVGRGEPVL